jgi:hypothetical protein
MKTWLTASLLIVLAGVGLWIAWQGIGVIRNRVSFNSSAVSGWGTVTQGLIIAGVGGIISVMWPRRSSGDQMLEDTA